MIRSTHIRLAAALVAATLIPSVVLLPAEAHASTTFTFRGTGYGHGIGMSQYGAQGSALAGKDYRWILGYYYTDTAVSTATAKTIKVNLDPAVSPSTSPYSRASWRVLAGQPGQTIKINGAVQVAGTYTFTGSGSSIVVKPPVGDSWTLTGTVTVEAAGGSPPLVQVVEGTGIYGLANAKYRGKLLLTSSSGKIKLVNQLPMEWYLYGVVPRESPASWHAEALKAQAVTARSYAYSDTKSELYCTTWDQAYQGYGGYNSYGVWVGEVDAATKAVDATKDEVVKYGSTVIRTFFFSQSGGHTANNDDVWVSGAPLPYLRGVPDVYEHLATPTLSPWPATREKTLTGVQLRDALGSIAGVPPAPAEVVRITPEPADSGHMRYMTFHFNTGASVRVSGDTVRSRLGLLSTAFYVSGFPVDRIAGANRYETAAAVSKLAYPSTAPAVVVASGEDYPDALTGSAVAGAVGGPLLLTANAGLSPATEIELRRLGPAAVYIMGSDASISVVAEERIRAVLPSVEVVRFSGRNRYETALLAARFVRSMTEASGAILVSGTGWPDAASASALAYAERYPILLTQATSLSGEAANYLKANTPETVLIVGGTPTVAEAVESAAAAAAGVPPVRLAGSDRYATSAAVARYSVANAGFTVDRAYLATGLLYPDALTGGMLAGVQRRPMLLMRPDSVPGGTAAFLREHRATIANIGIFGGLPTISQAGVDSISTVMMQ